jgi:hypothetical protein
MKIKISNVYEYLLAEELTDRQKLWLAFWSHVYANNSPRQWYRLHSRDFEFMLGITEKNYLMVSKSKHYQSATPNRLMGPLAKEFQVGQESKSNLLFFSTTMNKKYRIRQTANYPSLEVEITDPEVCNTWMYLLGRLHAGVVGPNKMFPASNSNNRFTLDPDFRVQMNSKYE